MKSIQNLLDVMATLRDPQQGCPWDIEQTFATIAPYTIEEAYEVADAIAQGDMDHLREELGDLLLQVVFHAQMAKEQNVFDFHQVVTELTEKLIRRHPHVFGEIEVQSLDKLNEMWEAGKAKERAGKDQHSVMDGIALALPALNRAYKMQKRAAKLGFDWPDVEPVYAKIQEEIIELQQAVSPSQREEEIGDLLFAVTNLARFYQVDAEHALRLANTKFERRFRSLEALAKSRNITLENGNLEQLDALWDEIKAVETGHE